MWNQKINISTQNINVFSVTVEDIHHIRAENIRLTTAMNNSIT